LIEVIGGGGSGVVWKAQANGNNYAIKFINSTDKDKKKPRFSKKFRFAQTCAMQGII